MSFDRDALYLGGGVLFLLVLASVLGLIFKLRLKKPGQQSFVENFNSRTKAWWMMCGVFSISLATGGVGTVIMFALMSFLAFREFVAIIPFNKKDHRALFWIFFIALPIQYYLVYIGWYGLFAIFIPVYCFLLIPARITVADNCDHFFERISKIQWGLMACIYCISHAPALLRLEIEGFEGQNWKLLFFFVLIVELCDVFQYTWGKLFGKHKILPVVSPNKTWEGFIGGVLSAGLLGGGLWWATPFTPLQAFTISIAIGFMGFCGDVTFSAIKRDANIKDYGTFIQGHGGILDRIDSLCFAAPIFFHVTRFITDPQFHGF